MSVERLRELRVFSLKERGLKEDLTIALHEWFQSREGVRLFSAKGQEAMDTNCSKGNSN